MGVWYGTTKAGRVIGERQPVAEERAERGYPGTRKCPECGEWKHVSEFYGGGTCRDCRASTGE